jgi:hypothetical protein
MNHKQIEQQMKHGKPGDPVLIHLLNCKVGLTKGFRKTTLPTLTTDSIS